MIGKFPYVASAGPLVKSVAHLRKSFPKEVTAETLRKLGVAPKNESYVINVLRFIGLIDDEGKKVEEKAKALVNHHEPEFAKAFGKLVEEAYGELFELHGESAWKLDRGTLTQFFRTTDHSSDVVGTRQASTFSALAALSGHGDVPISRVTAAKTTTGTAAKSERTAKPTRGSVGKGESSQPTTVDVSAHGKGSGIGLTVRIEVNLPASGDQDTYDRIFQSIRKNLLNVP